MNENRYLCRGKSKESGKWVTGIYSPYNWDVLGKREEKPQIIIISENKYLDGLWCEVEPETVGQCTGLTDKNGKKIFEGDIIKTQPFRNKPYSLSAKTKCHIGVVENCVGWNGNHWAVKIEDYEGHEHGNPFENCEIIGNLHDNSELLKG